MPLILTISSTATDKQNADKFIDNWDPVEQDYQLLLKPKLQQGNSDSDQAAGEMEMVAVAKGTTDVSLDEDLESGLTVYVLSNATLDETRQPLKSTIRRCSTKRSHRHQVEECEVDFSSDTDSEREW